MKSLIHRGYFKEMFRQLKVAGIVSAAILMASNIVTFLNVASTVGLNLEYYSIPTGGSLAPVMLAYVYVVGVLLTFSAFGWMNKRSLSDFYHGLPIKRTQIYFTSVIVIMLWMIIGLTAYAVVHALIYVVLGVPFNYLLFLGVYANMLIGALEVVGAASLACAISGTRFVNLFATAVILFVPRFLFSILAVFINSIDQNLSSSHLVVWSISVFFNPTYNIIATPYNSLLSFVSIDYANVGAMIYCFVYSMILVLLGWRAFLKRRSEAAGNPTTSKIYQSIIRIAVGLPLLLVLTYSMVADGVGSLAFIVIMVLLSFIAYSLYELISTKSAKKMAKAMPGFLICIAICALYVGLAYGITRLEYNVKVTDKNITAYQEIDDSEYTVLDSYMNRKSYSEIKSESIKYNDKESLEIIAKAYQRTIDSIDAEGRKAVPNYTVKICRKGRDIIRAINLTNAEQTRLEELREADKRYVDAAYSFPEGMKYYSVTYLSLAEAKQVGRVFEEEFNSLTNEQKLSLKSNSGWFRDYDDIYFEGEESAFTLTVYGCLGAKNYSDIYKLNGLTPRALAKAYELLNEKNGKKVKDALDKIIDWAENGGEHIDFDINFGKSELSQRFGWISFSSSKYCNMMYENMKQESSMKFKDTDPEIYEILKILSKAETTNDPGKGVLVIFEIPTSVYSYERLSVNLDLSESDVARIAALLSSLQGYEDEPVYYD
ncbi:MAG: ABC transporter permease [Clostridiales bacterium]|nr:ABC transporter permease [Clostridiales bacterium]